MESLLSLDRPIHRFAYLFNTLATLAISSGLGYGLFQWLSPKHGFYPLAWFLCIVIGAFAAGILLLLTIRRLRDIQGAAGRFLGKAESPTQSSFVRGARQWHELRV